MFQKKKRVALAICGHVFGSDGHVPWPSTAKGLVALAACDHGFGHTRTKGLFAMAEHGAQPRVWLPWLGATMDLVPIATCDHEFGCDGHARPIMGNNILFMF